MKAVSYATDASIAADSAIPGVMTHVCSVTLIWALRARTAETVTSKAMQINAQDAEAATNAATDGVNTVRCASTAARNQKRIVRAAVSVTMNVHLTAQTADTAVIVQTYVRIAETTVRTAAKSVLTAEGVRIAIISATDAVYATSV